MELQEITYVHNPNWIWVSVEFGSKEISVCFDGTTYEVIKADEVCYGEYGHTNLEHLQDWEEAAIEFAKDELMKDLKLEE